MTTIEKSITALLKRYSRVIIPGFGTIIRQPAFPDGLLFNQYIHSDDGLLLDYLAVSTGDRDEATSAVFRFVSEINTGLDQGETMYIERLGYFIKFEGLIGLYSRLKDIPHEHLGRQRIYNNFFSTSIPSSVTAPPDQETCALLPSAFN